MSNEGNEKCRLEEHQSPAGEIERLHFPMNTLHAASAAGNIGTVAADPHQASGRWTADDERTLVHANLDPRFAALFFAFKTSFRGKNGERRAAEVELAGLLVFWFGPDLARIARLLWLSGLKRSRWRTDPNYVKRLVTAAIAGCTTFCPDPDSTTASAIKAQANAKARDADAVVQAAADAEHRAESHRDAEKFGCSCPHVVILETRKKPATFSATFRCEKWRYSLFGGPLCPGCRNFLERRAMDNIRSRLGWQAELYELHCP